MIGDYEPSLLGCPFCGKHPKIITDGDPGDCAGRIMKIFCEDCDIHVEGHYYVDDTIYEKGKCIRADANKAYSDMLKALMRVEKRWNTRPVSAPKLISATTYREYQDSI